MFKFKQLLTRNLLYLQELIFLCFHFYVVNMLDQSKYSIAIRKTEQFHSFTLHDQFTQVENFFKMIDWLKNFMGNLC